jgi:CMP-N-acetylneuraminic acid synthetase
MNTEKPLCIIPARGGSQRFPRKNIAPLGGKPLIAWTIEAAIESGIYDTAWVSSEDDEILEVSEKWGAKALSRPDDLAGHSVIIFELCQHLIREFLSQGENYTAISILLPTSPFRSAETIRQAWEAYAASDAAALMSVVPTEHPPEWTLNKGEDERMDPKYPNRYELPRPDLPQAYRHDGGHQIARIPDLLNVDEFIYLRPIAFSVPAEETIDINEPLDLEWAEFYLNHNK